MSGSRSDIPSPRRIGFLLIPGFALMSYASSIEPLRAANRLAGRAVYDWRHFSPAGATVASSTGALVPVDGDLSAAGNLDMLVVCAGGDRIDFAEAATLGRLRRLARRGVAMAGVSGGPVVLARAGLLDGFRCTVHWEHAAAFVEEFPALFPTGALFEIDRGRLTSAGGIAALDMMHAVIEGDHGAALAGRVNDWFLQTGIRQGGGAQRMDPRLRLGLADERVARVVAAMEARIEDPVPRAELAALAGLSLRQLERLFSVALGTGVAAHYLGVRLDRARSLLRQTAMPVAEVALACGFSAPAHFARAYRRRFGQSPRVQRG
ncbi:GlxA family transcriptional regulator [Zavarzinia compransoris]|uniref:GlxA family transcriptional regulator n=1 Tax=Zavarzinia marina TaxID=2911065 RepID=UPI001F1A0E62|nr:GlxA family transcriptional regulator [Zavarzinia marina]MCF4167622.1 GlxA family transcriptional regulator [Zavarzinia marina]